MSAGDKLKAESKEAFEAFAIYRNMGVSRNTRTVAEQLTKSEAIIRRWCTQHRWVKRCGAWDNLVDRQERLGELRAVQDMRKRQVALGLKMQKLGDIELGKMLKQAETRKKKRGEVDEKTILKMIEVGSKLERTALGEPGEIVQNTGEAGQDLSVLTTGNLKELRDMRAKLRRRQLAELERTEDEE